MLKKVDKVRPMPELDRLIALEEEMTTQNGHLEEIKSTVIDAFRSQMSRIQAVELQSQQHQ